MIRKSDHENLPLPVSKSVLLLSQIDLTPSPNNSFHQLVQINFWKDQDRKTLVELKYLLSQSNINHHCWLLLMTTSRSFWIIFWLPEKGGDGLLPAHPKHYFYRKLHPLSKVLFLSSGF